MSICSQAPTPRWALRPSARADGSGSKAGENRRPLLSVVLSYDGPAQLVNRRPLTDTISGGREA